MHNPHESPAQNAAYPKVAIPVSLVMLVCALLLTEVFATINTIDEAYGFGRAEIVFTILIAGISQLPGLFIAFWRWKRNSVAAIPFLWGAYIIALTGSAVYAKYAFDGTADLMKASGHMHFIGVPILHCVFAVVIYAACAIVSLVLTLLWKPRRRDEQSHALEPAARLVSNGKPSPPAQ